MEYTKPELNQLGVAQSLVLGQPGAGEDLPEETESAFEFEE
jgi:hypothetical protein